MIWRGATDIRRFHMDERNPLHRHVSADAVIAFLRFTDI